MATSLDDNRAAREAILGRVRKALGKSGSDAHAIDAAHDYLARRERGPRPRQPADLVTHFMQRARDLGSTVERVAARQEIPHAVARYIDALVLPDVQADQKSTIGVCWPEFADLDWSGAGLSIEMRPTRGHDRLGITAAFCAIAETGTLAVLSGAEAPTATAILPDTHVAILRAERVVAGMEDAFALIRAELQIPPRAVNLISGPSRTGDIEQTIVLGAHGPCRVHVLVLG